MPKSFHRIVPEVKQDVLRRIKEEGVSVSQAAKDHGIHETTIVIWNSPADVQSYRDGGLMKEVIAFESQLNLPATRDGYPVAYGTSIAVLG